MSGVRVKELLSYGPKKDTCTKIQMSARSLGVSMMLPGVSNNIVLPGDSRAGDILKKSLSDGFVTPESGAGNWVLSRRSSQTM